MFKPTLSIVAAATLVASLGAETLTIDPIVVTAAKTEQTRNQSTANIDILTAAELEEKHYMTLTEALDSLPGISFTSNGGLGSSQEIFIRGMEGKRILVLIDGIRNQDPSNTSGVNYSDLLITDIERIEIIKGAQSGIWGADASAGVINIITKKADEGTHAGIHLEKGSFNTKKWGGSISHKTSLYDLKLSFNRIMSDSFSVQTPYGDDPKMYEKDPYANTTVNFSGHIRPTSNDTIGFTHTNISALSSYDDYLDPNAQNRSAADTSLSGLLYEKHFNDHTLSARANLSKFKRDELDTTRDVKIFNGKTKEVELRDEFHYNKDDFIVAGVNKQWFDVNFIRVDQTGGESSVNSKAVFATNSNRLNNLILTESLRYDDFSNFNGKTTGKIGAKYFLEETWFLSANYGTAYTAPNQIQIFNPWGASNDLKPESSRSYDLSIGNEYFTLTGFQNNVKDLVNWTDPTPLNWANNDGYYENTNGTSTFSGYELAFNDNFANSIGLNINYTYLYKSENDLGERLRKRPKEELEASIDYYGIDKLHIGINGHYVGTRYEYDNNEGRQTGRYSIFGAVANYDLTSNVKLFVKIDNITDKYYQITDGYATSSRAFNAGLKASF